MIDAFFDILLNRLLGVSLLLIVLMGLRPLVLKYLNAKVAYSMWLIIPVFIFLPFELLGTEGSSSVITVILGENILSSERISQQLFENDLIKDLALMIWAIGIIISTGLSIFRFKKLSRSLVSFDSADQISSLQLSKNSKLNIVKSHLVDVPAIFGFVHPYLILPSNFLDFPQVNQAMILRHELFHIRRHDHRINVLRLLVKNLFWFNPLVYLADKYCEADQEISCDLGVLQGSPNQEKKQYAKALIESASLGSQNQLVSQWKYHSLIKERVKMLKNTNTKSWHKWVAIVLSASVLWLTNGLVMANKASPDNSFENITKVATKFVMSLYPRAAELEGIEGLVKIKFDIDSFGRLYNVDVIKSEPEGIFDEVALIAAYQWRFENNKGQKDMIYTMEYALE